MPMTLALFSDYPEISAHLPHVCLGGFPTPIEKLGALGVRSDTQDLFIQRRDSIIEEQVRTFEQLHGAPLYVIPFGGTSTIGTAAYVNAAFELKQQISDGLMPELDYIYVALATMGTAAGLALGLKVARL